MIETKCLGLSQTDELLKSALEVGIHELRRRPELLDYCFAWLPKDALTSGSFGQNEVDQAKRWFLSTEVPVVAGYRIDHGKLPCVSVSMLRDAETNNTLADLHYDTFERKGGWPDLCRPFVPLAYSPDTGIMRLPPETTAELFVVAGQVLADKLGRTAEIRERLSIDQIRIDPHLSLEVSGLVVRGRRPAKLLTLRNAYFDESFLVGCHAMDDQSRTIWLYAIIKFCLLRGRRALLEARGFERTSISGSDLKQIQYLDASSQPGFARYLTVSGSALNVWPDEERDAPEAIEWSFSFRAADGADLRPEQETTDRQR